MPAEGYKLTEKDAATIELLDKRMKLNDTSRLDYERQVFLNIAMFLGHHWVDWNSAKNSLYTPEVPEHRVRLVINHIFPWVKSKVSKMLKTKPKLLVGPATMEEEDRNTAKVGEKFLTYIEREDEMTRKWIEFCTWACTSGTGIGMVSFNPKAGSRIGPRPEPSPEDISEINLEAEAEKKASPLEDVYEGEIETEIINSLEYRQDPLADSIKTAKWAGVIGFMALDDIKTLWAKYGKYVEAESRDRISTYDQKLEALGGTHEIGYKHFEDSQEKIEGAYVRRMFERPSKKYSDGRYVVEANGVVLIDEKNPTPIRKIDNETYEYGELPFFLCRETVIPGKAMGGSTIEQMTPPQMELDRTRSQIVENKNMISRPKYQVSRSAGLHPDALTSAPGEIVFVNGTLFVQRLDPPTMPEYVFAAAAKFEQDIDNIGSRHDVSQGKVPSGVRSGAAIAYLQEQDDTVLGPTVEEFHKALERWGRLCLLLAQRYYSENRKMKIVGRNNEFEIMDFDASTLNSVDVYCEVGSHIPLSRAVTQQYVLDLAHQGFLDQSRERDRELVFRTLELGNVEEIFEDRMFEQNYARGEERQIMQGLQPQVMEYHDHAIHIQSHNRFRMTRDYMTLDPRIQNVMDEHVVAHRDALAFLTAQAQKAMAMMQGGQNGKEKIPLPSAGPGAAQRGPGGAPTPRRG